eukprot:gene17699-biopygen17906
MNSLVDERHLTRAWMPPMSRRWSRLSVLRVSDSSDPAAFSTTESERSDSRLVSTWIAPSLRAVTLSSRATFHSVAAAYSRMPLVSFSGGPLRISTSFAIALQLISASLFSASVEQFRRMPSAFSFMLKFSWSSTLSSFGNPLHSLITCLLSLLMLQIHRVLVSFSSTEYLVLSSRSMKR